MPTTTTIDITELPDWLTSTEAADILRTQTRFVQKLGKSGLVETKPADRPGLARNALLYSGEDLRKYLSNQQREPSTNPKAVLRREYREKQKERLALVSGARYKSLTLILRAEAGSTRITLGNPERNFLLANKVTASLVRLHEYSTPSAIDAEGRGEED